MRIAPDHIRNFSIIAHIDHGKSTLADRILELTEAVPPREMREQVLDSLALERERGITIKLNAVSLIYHARDGGTYLFNLIDTPGHVDFSYEVSRSLAACEGALLVVDASQGVEAQTLANAFLALDDGLSILPVLNKIDLPSAHPDLVKEEIKEKIGISVADAKLVSAKTGEGVPALLEAVVKDIPAPKGDPKAPLRALIFDSHYDSFRGVIVLVRVFEGTLRTGDHIRLMAAEKDYVVTELGIRTPHEVKVDELGPGEVGFLAAQIKDIRLVRTGETLTHAERPASKPLPGYRRMKPMVYSGLYPVASDDYQELKDALAKLALSDASFTYEPETSEALGFGFRCGFLGLLHMDVVQERLEREYHLDLILTAPSVVYRVILTNGNELMLANPAKLPPPTTIKEIDEPYVSAEIMTPKEYVGPVMELCQEGRGVYLGLDYFDEARMLVRYELPLSSIIRNFHDRLKSRTRGYASMDYEVSNYRKGELTKLEILLNGTPVDALATIVTKADAYKRGEFLARKLKEVIPRQQFEVPIQAAVNGKVIARTNVKPVRKDVLAKCYGGDISRKKKLLEKQKEGKRRLKSIGSVEIPQAAFMSVLSIGDED